MEKLFGKYTSLIWAISILFFAGYFAIGIYNFYQLDDLTYLYNLEKKGLWNYFIQQYYGWETNYNFLFVLAVYTLAPVMPPLVFNLLIYASNVICFYALLTAIFKKHSLPVNGRDRFLLSFFLIGCCYFSCRGSGNVTYWLAAQLVYVFYLNYLFLGLYFWLNNRVVGACIFMFLFAHTRVNYDVIFMSIYVAWIGLQFLRQKTDYKFVAKNHLPLLFFIIGMITYLIIPGNYVRGESLFKSRESSVLSDLIKIGADWVGSYFLQLKRLVQFPLLIIIALSIPLQKINRLKINKRLVLIVWAAYIIGYWAQAVLLYFIFGAYFGSSRVYFLTDFMGMLAIFITCIYISKIIQQHWNTFLNPTLLRVGLLLFCFMLLGVYYKNVMVVKKFHVAKELRISTILKAKEEGRKEKLLLSRLPPAGMLDFMELRYVPDSVYHYEADIYRFYYDLPFEVGLKPTGK